MTIEIPIRTRAGIVRVIVDDGYAELALFTWHIASTGHVRRSERYGGWRDNRRRTVYTHRLILGDPPYPVAHRNGNKLDNRRANLGRPMEAA